MRAIPIERRCEPTELAVSAVASPICLSNGIRIGAASAPVSYALSLLIAGRYQRKPALPFIPGNTVAGTVVEIGRENRRFKPGDRVVASLECGGLAEEAVANEANVYGISDSMSLTRAVTLNTSYNSVLAALTCPHLLAVDRTDILLVHGATDGVGTAAIEIGRHLGACVIASASSAGKREFARLRGAHQVISSDTDNLRDVIMDLTDGRGGTRVLDPVGRPPFEQSLRCFRPEGRILPIGFASGTIPGLPANLLLVNNITVCGLYMGYYKIDTRVEWQQRVRALFDRLEDWFEAGIITPHIAGVYPLRDTSKAFAALLDRNQIGHVIVRTGDDA